VCGDLTSCLDFSGVDARPVPLPATQADATRAAALDGRTTPPTPAEPTRPHQVAGFRPACPGVYALECERETAGDRVRLSFVNTGNRAAVFHVYDRMNLEAGPRRYTVEGGQRLQDDWSTAGGVDLQVMGPDGFHRRFVGAGDEVVSARLDWRGAAPVLVLTGRGEAEVTAGAGVRSLAVDGEHRMDLAWDDANHRYDIAVEAAGWRSEFAGRG